MREREREREDDVVWFWFMQQLSRLGEFSGT